MTDALKRALRSFGNVLGNCLYDKVFISNVSKIKLAPPKFDPTKLHRRPEYLTSNTSVQQKQTTAHQNSKSDAGTINYDTTAQTPVFVEGEFDHEDYNFSNFGDDDDLSTSSLQFDQSTSVHSYPYSSTLTNFERSANQSTTSNPFSKPFKYQPATHNHQKVPSLLPYETAEKSDISTKQVIYDTTMPPPSKSSTSLYHHQALKQTAPMPGKNQDILRSNSLHIHNHDRDNADLKNNDNMASRRSVSGLTPKVQMFDTNIDQKEAERKAASAARLAAMAAALHPQNDFPIDKSKRSFSAEFTPARNLLNQNTDSSADVDSKKCRVNY